MTFAIKIITFKHRKNTRKNIKIYLQVIADSCVKMAVFEVISEKKTRESVVETNIYSAS